MTASLEFAISLGPAKTGLTLNAQLVDEDGANVGSAIASGFTEIGTGTYILDCTTIPNTAFRGAIHFYESGIPATILAISAINPSDLLGTGGLGAIEFTYTVTDSVSGDPIGGATVQISTDLAGTNIVWSGVTDAFGVARNVTTTEKPFLQAGTYYFWSYKSGFSFNNPDTEVVS